MLRVMDTTGECQIAASDGQRVVIYPRLNIGRLRSQLNNANARGLTVLAVALYNTIHAYDWRLTLQSRSWLDMPLEMRRKPGEYKNTQHVLIVPAKEQVYTLAQFEQLMLGSG